MGWGRSALGGVRWAVYIVSQIEISSKFWDFACLKNYNFKSFKEKGFSDRKYRRMILFTRAYNGARVTQLPDKIITIIIESTQEEREVKRRGREEKISHNLVVPKQR